MRKEIRTTAERIRPRPTPFDGAAVALSASAWLLLILQANTESFESFFHLSTACLAAGAAGTAAGIAGLRRQLRQGLRGRALDFSLPAIAAFLSPLAIAATFTLHGFFILVHQNLR